MQKLGNAPRLASWALRLTAAAILGQTLYFKFTGAEQSVHLFTMLGMEPWGRIGTGIAELVACALLLASRTAWAGALLALGLMAGAVASHLAILGIEVEGDGGLLFGLAVTVLLASLGTLWLHRGEVPVAGRSLAARGRPVTQP